MKVPENVLKRAENYIVDKDYGIEILDQNKVRKEKKEEIVTVDTTIYDKGDRVRLLDYDDYGIVYATEDKFSNVQVYYKGEMLVVNQKRLKLK